MRSGIGPRTQLESFGIEVVRNVPAVGAKLSDHPALSLRARVKDPGIIDADHPIVQTILRYTSKNGPRNDLQIEAFSYSTRAGSTKSGVDLDCIAIAAVLEQVEGTGKLELASADPRVGPVVRNHFCEDERDLVRLRECFKDTIAYTETRAMREIIDEVVFPAPDRPLDDDTIDMLLQRFAASGYHPCATVRMGPLAIPTRGGPARPGAHGGGLVVADASIMPTVPRANTNLTAI
jgi:choline dehydrogenase